MKSHDIVILCKLVSLEKEGKKDWTYSSLSNEVFLSVGETHNSVRRLVKSRLYDEKSKSVIKSSMLEYVIHGVKYTFPPEYGSMDRGVPTSHSSPVFKDKIKSNGDAYVWPYYKGKIKGISIMPLSKKTPEACLKDPFLYSLLSLIDGIRIGRARERNIAVEQLSKLIEK